MKKKIFARFISFVLAAVCTATCLCTYYSEFELSNDDISISASAADNSETVISLINAERTANGLTPFAQNEKLDAIADIRARELAESFAFTRPDGTDVYSLFDEYGLICANVFQSAASAYTAQEVAQAWIENTPVLSQEYDTIAVGSAVVGGTLYWYYTIVDIVSTDEINAFADEVIRLVNVERAANGLDALTKNERLSAAAAKRAQELVEYYSHTRPDGTNCFTVLDDFAITYYAVGENIAMGQSTPQEVMEDWMNSEGHRANILETSFENIGVGVVYANGMLHWVQLFAKIHSVGNLPSDTSYPVVSVEFSQNDIYALADDKTPLSNSNFTVKAKLSNGTYKNITTDCKFENNASPYTVFWANADNLTNQCYAKVVYNGTDSAVNEYFETMGNKTAGVAALNIAMRGDANLDNAIDTRDASVIASYSSALASLPSGADKPTLSATNNELALLAADPNADGGIDTRDASLIASYSSASAASTINNQAEKYYTIWSGLVSL